MRNLIILISERSFRVFFPIFVESNTFKVFILYINFCTDLCIKYKGHQYYLFREGKKQKDGFLRLSIQRIQFVDDDNDIDNKTLFCARRKAALSFLSNTNYS